MFSTTCNNVDTLYLTCIAYSSLMCAFHLLLLLLLLLPRWCCCCFDGREEKWTLYVRLCTVCWPCSHSSQRAIIPMLMMMMMMAVRPKRQLHCVECDELSARIHRIAVDTGTYIHYTYVRGLNRIWTYKNVYQKKKKQRHGEINEEKKHTRTSKTETKQQKP